jgi:hypothetical protein
VQSGNRDGARSGNPADSESPVVLRLPLAEGLPCHCAGLVTVPAMPCGPSYASEVKNTRSGQIVTESGELLLLGRVAGMLRVLRVLRVLGVLRVRGVLVVRRCARWGPCRARAPGLMPASLSDSLTVLGRLRSRPSWPFEDGLVTAARLPSIDEDGAFVMHLRTENVRVASDPSMTQLPGVLAHHPGEPAVDHRKHVAVGGSEQPGRGSYPCMCQQTMLHVADHGPLGLGLGAVVPDRPEQSRAEQGGRVALSLMKRHGSLWRCGR